ncbi:acetyl-CoA carboxylase biotin carboxylase subunit [Alteromonas sp. 345S023]|uniref:Biotin carboxylase n=1 Tax=Alteromonas profundi TaxID=2696062 RepID=A0A7X5LJS4_9ALTE|nr:acetyl/propionyl/methylcrotonyl-CoA carboxylase subunit alpha [Alteromonas profundi]NDV89995.1 acetyl-CoA carboxylase biotin carboxylase subunit [Alteromonas profundi]
MISKLLIANRGEIACRVIETAKKLGIQTVAVYSEADANARHVAMADEAVLLGPAPSKDSYLKGDKILAKAKALNVDAIHPGYGFLSENAEFAKACQQQGVIFVGPPASAIEAMGSKSAAKRIMQEAGVPLVPGYHGDDQDEATLKASADEMGYPVLLKAAAGGGGKGMRQVWSEKAFTQALNAAKRESMASFGDDHMLVEKYLTRPRHVEIQVFCDSLGNGVYLFERDCSVQRRHQKIIEEAPAPNMPEGTREKMGEAALKAAKAINYEGAGTVEFLLDEDGSFYFMEMNTRLQVEHPVTEMITGEDLVEWQLAVAEGKPLPKQQNELKLKGHAFEARIYAEDPDNDFLPSTGNLALLSPPPTSNLVRVDTGVLQGDDVTVYYDPMIAKLVVWGEHRDSALQRLYRALGDYHISGVTTNINFLKKVANCEPFKRAQLTTTFIEQNSQVLNMNVGVDVSAQLPAMALLSVLSRREGHNNTIATNAADTHQDTVSVWDLAGSWRVNSYYSETLNFLVEEREYTVVVTHLVAKNSHESPRYRVSTATGEYTVSGSLNNHVLIAYINDERSRFSVSHVGNEYGLYSQNTQVSYSLQHPDLGGDHSAHGDSELTAPMNGTIVAHLVAKGDKVGAGDPLLVMEAMKMEHSICAPSNGSVTEFFYQPGELVDGGAVLFEFEPDSE